MPVVNMISLSPLNPLRTEVIDSVMLRFLTRASYYPSERYFFVYWKPV